MSKKYDENSIQKLDPLSFTRLRSDTYLGSNEDSTQLVREIITNCYDEFLAGNCTKINVWYNQDDNSITILDNGQGILPNVQKEDGRTILEMVYGDINTSGKYDKSDSAVYKTSTGAFGIGASLTCFLSHWLKATTCRDGQYETVEFIEGKFHSRKTGKTDKDKHGVEVSFQPSEEFFRNAKPNLEALRKEFFNMSCVCAGLEIYFEDKRYYHPLGLKSLLEVKVKDEITLFDIPFAFTETKDRQYLDFVMISTSSSKSTFDCFCNYSIVEAGTPITAVKSCITRIFNKWAKDNGLLKKDNLSGNDIQEGMIVIFNLASPNIRYDSQTKVRVTSTEDNTFISEVLGKKLELWLDNNPEDAKIIIDKALLARKAAEAAKKARAAVKNKAEKKDKAFKLPTTLSDAWSKNRQKCELFICEGKSAASGLIEAKDSETQAVYGVRGKMLSVLKTTPDKIVKNQEINNILQALGLDYNPQNGKCKYDKDKLRYGKIIAAADADFDGFAIENLLFNILWYLCPDLIIEGHVYSAVPPLYRVTTKKNEYIYLRDDKALEEYKKEHSKDIQFIGREKGLGEMDSEELSHCLLEPENRNLYQLVVSDIGQTDMMFEDLYGRKVEPRVKFLAEHLEEARVD